MFSPGLLQQAATASAWHLGGDPQPGGRIKGISWYLLVDDPLSFNGQFHNLMIAIFNGYLKLPEVLFQNALDALGYLLDKLDAFGCCPLRYAQSIAQQWGALPQPSECSSKAQHGPVWISLVELKLCNVGMVQCHLHHPPFITIHHHFDRWDSNQK